MIYRRLPENQKMATYEESARLYGHSIDWVSVVNRCATQAGSNSFRWSDCLARRNRGEDTWARFWVGLPLSGRCPICWWLSPLRRLFMVAAVMWIFQFPANSVQILTFLCNAESAFFRQYLWDAMVRDFSLLSQEQVWSSILHSSEHGLVRGTFEYCQTEKVTAPRSKIITIWMNSQTLSFIP
jgi:hypothetical protein